MEEKTIVRQNMMDDKNYTPYCGLNGKCIGSWPRTVWKNGGLVCPSCGFELKFEPDFFKRYKKKWGIKK